MNVMVLFAPSATSSESSSYPTTKKEPYRSYSSTSSSAAPWNRRVLQNTCRRRLLRSKESPALTAICNPTSGTCKPQTHQHRQQQRHAQDDSSSSSSSCSSTGLMSNTASSYREIDQIHDHAYEHHLLQWLMYGKEQDEEQKDDTDIDDADTNADALTAPSTRCISGSGGCCRYTHKVLISGYLQKMRKTGVGGLKINGTGSGGGGGGGKWQKRWFESNGETLCYYKRSIRPSNKSSSGSSTSSTGSGTSIINNNNNNNESQWQLLATLDLAKVDSICVEDNDMNQNENDDGRCFSIHVWGRSYLLRAESRASCRDWVITLNRIREARLHQGNCQLSVPKQVESVLAPQEERQIDDRGCRNDSITPIFTTTSIPCVVVVGSHRQRTRRVMEAGDKEEVQELE